MSLPNNLLYTQTHEWLKKEKDGVYTIGITDHAQGLLGDIVFVDLPEKDEEVDETTPFSVLESVKTAADLFAPVPGVIMEVNTALSSNPEAINDDPYNQGWIVRIKVQDDKKLEELMTAEQYETEIADQEH
jgi:glycine cleavage system H protein